MSPAMGWSSWFPVAARNFTLPTGFVREDIRQNKTGRIPRPVKS
jgi:hypothetical protein